MLPEFESLPVYKSENRSGTKERSKCNEKNLSAQSIAARQRRKKITEKTQELGKLIPGGQKMNTADMFQAAYKYINFLQTQVGILQVMGSYQKALRRDIAGADEARSSPSSRKVRRMTAPQGGVNSLP
ncbi:PREDICTED: transcription factor bHLH52-like [Nicotiana attenuata]|uniref:transcription factor bHLH52-like n=1 Tax=Nicotiana attenuata TaxID=49451 RepID=UPI0009046B96|nr:PREDICTED: transcription factor bHLH52-like [Nicotiana attenuata]